ncbi:MAG: hypothetical protein WDM76_16555 [Limisphaerales bacterium]
MIVVAIIGLLAAIAIPNFIRARTTSQAMLASTTYVRWMGPNSSGRWNKGSYPMPLPKLLRSHPTSN